VRAGNTAEPGSGDSRQPRHDANQTTASGAQPFAIPSAHRVASTKAFTSSST